MVFSLAVGLPGCQRQIEEAEHDTSERQPSVSLDVQIPADDQVAIGLATTKARIDDARQTILATGWLAAKPASEIVVKAPTAGFVTLDDDDALRLGDTVARDQCVATLRVFLSPQEQSQLVVEKEDADTLIEQSRATAQLAEAQLRRIEENAALDAVPGTRVLELRETIAHARAAEKEAREKLPFMPREPYNNGVGLQEVTVQAPLGGRLANVFFAPRQFVAQGDPLWTIADWSTLWLHVPVYAGDLSRIAVQESASAAVPEETTVYEVEPVSILQPTETGKQTVELLYEVDNQSAKLRPGQALSVSLPLGRQATETVVPRSAILWDGMGNGWVYVKTSPKTFRRRRIELGQYLGDDVVVRRGVSVGEEVVTTGAEALYGEEFQGQLRVQDDD